MSHEIRTPMNGILGFATLLKKPNLAGEKQQKYLGLIEESGNRLLVIINDLISISKIESGQMKISISEININEKMMFLFDFFSSEAERKGLELLASYPASTSPIIINTDAEKFDSILTNLIKNAIKFTERGTVEFGYEIRDHKLLFHVKDTGIGISKDKQEIIFDRFVQADLKPSRSYEGSGLGLSISKAYVEMLGGEIWLESEEDQGTQFYFDLPFNHNNNSDLTIKSENASNAEMYFGTTKTTILIAEDDEISLLYMISNLESTGFNLITAKTGQEAVDICKHNKEVKMVFMDIKMPEMDGFTAAGLLKSIRPDLPIIAQTAYALESDRAKYIKVFDDYLTKPVKTDDLKHIVNKYLRIS
jgi:CheY-like chemotaxis protein